MGGNAHHPYLYCSTILPKGTILQYGPKQAHASMPESACVKGLRAGLLYPPCQGNSTPPIEHYHTGLGK
jgi:hypothetical protein